MRSVPGPSGDISLKPGETSNASIAWSSPTGAPYNPVRPSSSATPTTRCSTAGSSPPTTRGRAARSTPRQRITGDASGFTSSPWAYNGRIFAMSEDGDTYVIQAGPEFKVLGKNSLNEMTLATPAVARGSLFVRTASKLYRFTESRATGPWSFGEFVASWLVV